MTMFLQILLLIIGFIFLVKGSDWFVDGAANIASSFGIPQLIIGLTIVAMGTSAPEAAVSITAAFNGNADITIGNIVGSNILNVLIILGLSAIVYPLTVTKTTMLIDIPVTISVTILIFLFGLDGIITRIDGIILLVIFSSYIAFLIWSTKKEKKSLQLNQEQSTNNDSDNSNEPKISIIKAIFLTII